MFQMWQQMWNIIITKIAEDIYILYRVHREGLGYEKVFDFAKAIHSINIFFFFKINYETFYIYKRI